MKPGDEIAVIEFVYAHQAPASDARAFLAAACCCGFALAGAHPLDDYFDGGAQDLVELLTIIKQSPDKVRRIIRIAFNGKVKAQFGEEEIDIYEFRRRWESKEWCAAHPDHPLAYLSNNLGWLQIFNGQLAGQRPRLHFQRGRREAFLIQEGDPRYDAAKTEQLLEWYRNGWKG